MVSFVGPLGSSPPTPPVPVVVVDPPPPCWPVEVVVLVEAPPAPPAPVPDEVGARSKSSEEQAARALKPSAKAKSERRLKERTMAQAYPDSGRREPYPDRPAVLTRAA
jgi:hypothetical protein